MLKGFLLGLSLYPFPCVVYKPFEGWSEAKLRAYLAGVLTTFTLAISAMVVWAYYMNTIIAEWGAT